MNDEQLSFCASDSSVAIAQPQSKPAKIRILLIDDQNSVRQMLRLLLSEPDLEVVGIAADGETALQQIETLHPDIAIADINMPGMDGLTITQIISQRFPQTKVTIFSSYDEVGYIKKALEAGAKGYLLKNTPPHELLNAIRLIHKGYWQLGPGLYEKLNAQTIAVESSANPSQSPSVDRDWSDVTQEGIDTLPQVWTRGLLYAIVLFTAAIVPWGMLTRVDVIGSAKGRLEPKGNTVRLDAPIAGTVSAINAREGQRVKAGQTLVEFNSNVIRADLQQARAKLAGFVEQKNNLQRLENQLQENISTQQDRDRAEASEQLQAIDQIQQKIDFNRTAKASAQQLLAKDRAMVDRYENLREQGVVSGNQLDEVERQAIENEQKVKQAQSDLEQNQTELKKQQKTYEKNLHQGRLAIAEIRKQLKELQTQIVETRSQIAQSQNQIKSLQYQLQQSILNVPVNGMVFELSVRHPGAVVQPGGAIATIAPEGVPLVV
ncbi:MAG: response regulator, partial [Hydrococcus sp. Prado102]|nr:response regulator [Hydrococcus sp. Prado102]